MILKVNIRSHDGRRNRWLIKGSRTISVGLPLCLTVILTETPPHKHMMNIKKYV